MLLREVVLTWQIGRTNQTVQKPLWSGKWKTLFQMLMIAAWIAPIQNDPIGLVILGAVTVAALFWTFISWADYYKAYVQGKPVQGR